MKAAYFESAGKIDVRDVEKPKLKNSTDAIIRIVRACVCGSDLWWFRGITQRPSGLVGHEAIGIVDSIGSAVHQIKVGDFVVVPFTHGCGKCKICLAGFDGNCPNVEKGSNGGYQAEYLRAINADGALIKIPGQPEDYSSEMLASLTTLADVMPTGFHAADSAEVKAGDTVVVFGDGAVGLCAVIGAKLLGASRIIMMSRHEDRANLARDFGATDVIADRGEKAVEAVRSLTDGLGADAVLECVGTAQSIETAFQVARPGAIVGRVGLPHDMNYNPYMDQLFMKNIGIRGGIASVTSDVKNLLLEKVLDGSIEPGRVFSQTYKLEEIQAAYVDMDQRRTIKSLLALSD
ncbi:zinc-dependent alcohol dehydrogenase family protein [Lactococcus fujiensis]|uniref:Molecular chaperone GroES n=1 Tax=Lactococcus fujiensis JCM 16395 TaxID=1291764 RepID=A0A2A5RJW2_9LACT|nr:zinc-dependent alcohol dehydrogenase family protein [Lactococcus fujiensis]PCR99475.1 molecular chaperone GroES [Lactococcus fujiensis JCM 16395]